MDRIIRPYGPPAGSPPASAAPQIHVNAPAKLTKSSGDFLRALRRRCWLVLATALLIGIPGAVLVARQPNIYRTSASILIEPPRFDETVQSLLPNGNVGSQNSHLAERYVPNKIAELRGRGLASIVAGKASLAISPGGDPAAEIVGGLQTRKLPETTYYDVYLEGRDPERIQKLLKALLDEFENGAKHDRDRLITKSKNTAKESLDALEKELVEIDQKIVKLFEAQKTPVFGPGGRSILEQKYVMLSSVLQSKRLNHDQNVQDERIARLFPHARQAAPQNPYGARIAQLQEMKEYYTEQAMHMRGIVKKFDSDPASKKLTAKLKQTMDDLEKLQSIGMRDPTVDMLTDMRIRSADEIVRLEKEVKGLLNQQHEAMPVLQEYQTLQRGREAKEHAIQSLRERIQGFDIVSKTTNDPVKILEYPDLPTSPMRPNRALNLALVVVAALGMGVGLVCLLEHLDPRVKVPEHLAAGVPLPLFGVIPRMRRLAENSRGGHLWTPGIPRSAEADAFRNLRAGLLGLTGARGGPIVTLLVTSAKPGEGKSTVALNLAATCAKAGERTLLVDCDLRRPSLRDVFLREDDHDLGLVDVLQDQLPWQRTVIRTGVANLDYLPTGDPTGVPIEILGTIELRQLISALSGHYHRVIIDGPAVLGMADCRMLGRLVDAALLVVRAGAHGLDPLRRAREMLEQSRVPLAGIVFNGLDDDLHNWSSHAPETYLADARADRRLEAPAVEPARPRA